MSYYTKKIQQGSPITARFLNETSGKGIPSAMGGDGVEIRRVGQKVTINRSRDTVIGAQSGGDGIIRVATKADLPASGLPGRIGYVYATDREYTMKADYTWWCFTHLEV